MCLSEIFYSLAVKLFEKIDYKIFAMKTSLLLSEFKLCDNNVKKVMKKGSLYSFLIENLEDNERDSKNLEAENNQEGFNHLIRDMQVIAKSRGIINKEVVKVLFDDNAFSTFRDFLSLGIEHIAKLKGIDSAIDLACDAGDINPLKYLVKNGVVIKENINKGNNLGNTPLMCACRTLAAKVLDEEVYLEAIEFFVNNDADVLAKNYEGNQAIDFLPEQGFDKLKDFLNKRMKEAKNNKPPQNNRDVEIIETMYVPPTI